MIDPTAFLAAGAVVLGDVHLGRDASVWYNAVLRGDAERVVVGDGANIQDLSLLHADPGFPCLVGRRVTVGHRAILHGCHVEDDCLIGMGAILLNGARVGRGSVIGAGAVLVEGMEVPPGMLVLGVPGKVVREVDEAMRGRIEHAWRHYVELARRHRAGEFPIATTQALGNAIGDFADTEDTKVRRVMNRETSPSDGLGRDFIVEARWQLDSSVGLILHCLGQLDDEQVWWRPREGMNSIGNLLLHLAGNLQQRFGAVIAQEADDRDRFSEFTERGPIPGAELRRRFEEAARRSDEILAGLTPERLGETRRYDLVAGPTEKSVLGVALQALVHLNGHAQEILQMTRTQLGDGYAFRHPSGVPPSLRAPSERG